MNSSNITIDPICPDRAWYAKAGIKTAFVVFYISAPLIFFMSFFGHTFCLIAFRTQTKKEKAYVYQIFLTTCNILKSLSAITYVITFEWGSSPRDTNLAWPAYRACYTCMMFSSLVPIGLNNVLVTASQILSIFMSADRVYALWKPFSYKALNHKKIQISIATFSIIMGISTNFFHCFRFNVISITNENGTIISYQIVLNANFALSIMGNVLTRFQNIVDYSGLVSLYILNFSLFWLYRSRRKEAMKNLRSGIRLSSQEKRKQDTEKILAMLTITQSLCISVMASCKTLFYVVIFLKPSFYTCSGLLYAPLLVCQTQVMETVDMLMLFTVSRHVRRAIVKYLSFCKKSNVVIDVTPMAPSRSIAHNSVAPVG